MDSALKIGERVRFRPHHYCSGQTGTIKDIKHNPSGSICYYVVDPDNAPDHKLYRTFQLLGEDIEIFTPSQN